MGGNWDVSCIVSLFFLLGYIGCEFLFCFYDGLLRSVFLMRREVNCKCLCLAACEMNLST